MLPRSEFERKLTKVVESKPIRRKIRHKAAWPLHPPAQACIYCSTMMPQGV
jgi:hypothetical protein